MCAARACDNPRRSASVRRLRASTAPSITPATRLTSADRANNVAEDRCDEGMIPLIDRARLLLTGERSPASIGSSAEVLTCSSSDCVSQIARASIRAAELELVRLRA